MLIYVCLGWFYSFLYILSMLGCQNFGFYLCFVFLHCCFWVRVSSKAVHACLMHAYIGLLLCMQVLGLHTQPSVYVRRTLPKNPSLVFYFCLILFSYLTCSCLSFFYVYVYLMPLFHMFYCYLPLIC